MKANQTPPPACIAKKGITHATDNIGPDQQLHVPASVLMSFFGDELKARFLVPAPKENKHEERPDGPAETRS